MAVSSAVSLPVDAGALSTLAADYRILAELARDDLGTVFLAQQLRVGARRVALRVLPPAVEWDPERLAEFERQIAGVARLRHPSVLVVYECGELPDGTAYVATELSDGETLAARLQRTGPLSTPDLIAVVEQCAHALDTGHRAGIEHRELSVDRIVLVARVDATLTDTLNWTVAVKLEDFGLAHGEDIHAPDREYGRPGSGGLARPDIVSLALVTKAMLTGRWPGAQEPEVASAARPPAIPAEVWTVLGKALDAAGGYSTAGEFAQALREVLTVSASSESERQEPSPEPASPQRAASPGPEPVEGKAIFARPLGDVPSTPPPPWRARRSMEGALAPAASALARPDSPVDAQSASPPAAIPDKAEAPAQADQQPPIREDRAQRADGELAELRALYAALHAEHEASLQGLAEHRALVARLRETLAVVQHLIQSVPPTAEDTSARPAS